MKVGQGVPELREKVEIMEAGRSAKSGKAS